MKRGFVDSPDGQIHYRSAGDGPPVIILHSTPASSKSMSPLIQAVAEQGMRAIGMDTMGFGDSDRPNPPYTSLTQYAQSVAYLIKGLGYGKAHVLGLLTGAQIGLQVAADFPDVVDTLVIHEAFNWGTPERRAVHERLHRYHPRTASGSYLLELWNRVPVKTDLRTQEDRFLEFVKTNDTEGAEVYGTMGWEGAATWSMCRVDVWTVTPRIPVPVLITYGAGSERARAMDRFLKTIPRSRAAVNMPFYANNPSIFARAAAEFMRRPGV